MARSMRVEKIHKNDAKNIYRYVGGDQISFIDPFGLECLPGYCDGLDYIEIAGFVSSPLKRAPQNGRTAQSRLYIAFRRV